MPAFHATAILDPLSTNGALSANWKKNGSAAASITGGSLVFTAGGEINWVASAFTANQECYVTRTSLGEIVLVVRVQEVGGFVESYYCYFDGAGNWELGRTIKGNNEMLVEGDLDWEPGDVIGLLVEGNTLYAWYIKEGKGAPIELGHVEDTSLPATGKTGLYDITTGAKYNNFGGGSLAAGSASADALAMIV